MKRLSGGVLTLPQNPHLSKAWAGDIWVLQFGYGLSVSNTAQNRVEFLGVVNAYARPFEGFVPALLASSASCGRVAHWMLLARRVGKPLSRSTSLFKDTQVSPPEATAAARDGEV